MSRKMEQDLDRLLAEAAAEPAAPLSQAFMARLMADAARAQPPVPQPQPLRPRPLAPPSGAGLKLLPPTSGGWFGALADVFGGRGALAGMMLATVAGLYLGVAQPAALSSLTSTLYGETPLDSLDLLSGGDSLWTEQVQ